jgi:hypothetical protein
MALPSQHQEIGLPALGETADLYTRNPAADGELGRPNFLWRENIRFEPPAQVKQRRLIFGKARGSRAVPDTHQVTGSLDGNDSNDRDPGGSPGREIHCGPDRLASSLGLVSGCNDVPQ